MSLLRKAETETPPPRTQSKPENHARLDFAACVIVLVFLIFLSWFGATFHYVELCYSTEYDRYVEKADQLRQGILPADYYHGLLYPLLAAALGALLGDTFTGARTVSTMAAGVVLILTYLLGARCFSRKVALIATMALALNSLVVMCGVEAATDMLFSALGLACLLLSIRLLERPNALTIVGLGVCFSLSCLTRYTAVAIFPCVVLALWLSPFPSRRKRFLAALALVITVSVVLSPQFALNTYKFGGPFNTRAVDSLATKLFVHEGEGFVANSESIGMTGFVITHPLRVAVSFAQSLKDWIIDGLAGFVAGNRMFLGSALFTLALLGGVFAYVTRCDRRGILLLTYTATYFVVMCLFLATVPRYFLPILPPCMLIAVHFMTSNDTDRAYSLNRTSATRERLAVAAVLILLLIGTYYALPDMVNRHPYQELATAQRLETVAGRNIVVAGTFPFMQRYVGYTYHHLTGDFGNKGSQERMEYFQRLRSVLKETGTDYLIASAPSLGQRPTELLTGKNLPDYLQPERLDNDVALYRVRKERL